MSKLVKSAPAWHREVAAEIAREYVETNEINETARRRRARIGLMLIWVKEAGKADGSIPHGEFGPWLQTNLPRIPRATLGDYITEAKSICDIAGWLLGDICRFETPPHLLLLSRNGDLKGVEKERHEKLAAIIEQQKHIRAVTEYKQVELKDDATVPKRGRLKGSDGNPKHKRIAAAARNHEEFMVQLRALVENVINGQDELADDKHAGEPELGELFGRLRKSTAHLNSYLARIEEGRKKS